MANLFFRKVESSFSDHFDFLVIEPVERRFVGLLFAITLLFHLPQITGFSVSIDDEYGIYRTQLLNWISQGRWGVFLLYKISGIRPTLPFVHNIVFCGFITYSTLILYRLFRFRIDSFFVWNGLLFTSWPLYWFMLEFYGNIWPTALGIFITLIASFLYFGKKNIGFLSGFVFPAFLLAFAFSLYQVFFLYAFVLGTMFFFFEYHQTSKFSFLSFLKYVSCLLLSVTIYILISQAFLRFYNLETVYVDGLLSIRFWMEDPILVIRLFTREFLSIYFGLESVYANTMFGLKALVILFAGSLFFFFNRNVKRFFLGGFLLLLIALLPLALNLASNGLMFYRTMLGVPLVIWFMARIVHVSLPARFTNVLYIVLAVTYFNVLNSVSSYHASTQLCINHDQNTAALLYNRISQKVPGFSRDSTYSIFVYGTLNYQNPRFPDVMSSTMQGSFFEWDGGSSERVATFLNVMGYNNLISGQGKDFFSFKPIVNTMKSWPNDSSVVYQKGYVLIKLGN